MKLKTKFTTGNMLDWEEIFFDGVEDEGKGTYKSSFKPVKAAVVADWFSDIEPDADPKTVIRAVDSDELLEIAGQIIEIYQSKKIAESEPDPNS